MMLALTLTALFAVTAIATGLSLLDSWIRGRSAFGVLRREQALLNAGYVPQVDAYELRLRSDALQSPAGRTPAHRAAVTRLTGRRTLADARRGNARRLPLPEVA